ncbi:MAG: tetratricopeptide repeat protein [Elusimicrobia bacterium]|nr:tetratricopeptide repeat protein [Elusimicrobiota bacterium]
MYYMRKYYFVLILFVVSCTAVIGKDRNAGVSPAAMPGMQGFSPSETEEEQTVDDSIFSEKELSEIANETQTEDPDEIFLMEDDTDDEEAVPLETLEEEDEKEAERMSQEIIERILRGMEIPEDRPIPEGKPKKSVSSPKPKPGVPRAVTTPVSEPSKTAETRPVKEVKPVISGTQPSALSDTKITEELEELPVTPKAVELIPEPETIPEKAEPPQPVQAVKPVQEIKKAAPVAKKRSLPKPKPVSKAEPRWVSGKTLEYETHFKKGVEHYARRELRKAQQEFEQAIDENESDADAYYMLADVYYQLYDIEEAWRNIQIASNLDRKAKGPLYTAIEREVKSEYAMPLSVFIIFSSSLCMIFLGTLGFIYKRKDARGIARDEIMQLKKEIEVLKMHNDIQDPRVRYYKSIEACENASTMLALNNLKGAEEEFRTAIMLYPNTLNAYLGLGYIHFVEKKYENAITDYGKAIEIDPNSAVAYYGLGRSFGEKGNKTIQIEKIQTATQLDPSFREAMEALNFLTGHAS